MAHAMAEGDSAAIELIRETHASAKEASASSAAALRLAQENHDLLHGRGEEEGFKGRLSHIERTLREMRALHGVASDSKWRLVREIVVALIAGTALVLSSIGG